MSAIQNEANRQDKERLKIESLYYPLFVGLFNKINRYLRSYFKDEFNAPETVDINQFSPAFKRILKNLYSRSQKISYDDVAEFILEDEATKLKKSVQSLNAIENEKNIVNNLYYIINTTKDNIKDYYNKYDNKNDKNLSSFIFNEFKNNINNRSALISQQNVGIAYESQKHNITRASQDNYKKMWVTMDDDRVRLAHRNADMQEVDVNNFFIVDGETLMYPKDMSNGATIKNTINCRCVSIPFKVNK